MVVPTMIAAPAALANGAEVDIDIKPASAGNCMAIDDTGTVPVAVLGSADLDVSSIDIDEVRAANSSMRKNAALMMLPPGIAANAVDRVTKIRPGPSEGSRP